MLLFSSAYNEYTVISKEYIGPLGFDITGVDSISMYQGRRTRSGLSGFNLTNFQMVTLVSMVQPDHSNLPATAYINIYKYIYTIKTRLKYICVYICRYVQN